MKCGNCGSENVVIQVAQVGSETSFKTNGGGYEAGRVILIIITIGIWWIIEAFIGRKLYRSETQVYNALFAICQDCGDVDQKNI